MSKKLLTKKQIAERYSVKPRTIQEWISRYGLPCVRIGQNVLRFDPKAIEKWESERSEEITA